LRIRKPSFGPSSYHVGLVFLCLLSVCAPAARAAGTAKLSGIVYTISSDNTQLVWPNARITLMKKQTQTAVSTVSGELGQYSFTGLEPGEYELTVALAGFEDSVRQVKLEAKADLRVDFELRPQKLTEKVVVEANAPGVDVTSTSTAAPGITAQTLKSIPLLNQRFQDALPLLPGVIRGPDSLINIKGGRANQSTTLVNSSSAADPVTGLEAISLPIEAVESVKVLSNPFSAEYGQFASGVAEVATRSGTDEWKFLITDLFPRIRFRDHHWVGLESVTPRLTFAGPVVKNNFYVFQSFDYRFVRTRVPSLPNLRNDQLLETFDSYTQFDWNITANNRFTGSVSYYPQNLMFVAMNTFNPQDVSPGEQKRGYLIALKDRAIFAGGGFLESSFSLKRFDVRVFPSQVPPGVPNPTLVLYPEQNAGGYFHRENRISHLYQWAQIYHFHPLQHAGTHLLEFGYSYARADYQSAAANSDVVIQRLDHTTAQRIQFAAPASLSAAQNSFSVFLQDRWQLRPRFTLDFGARLDHDSLSRDAVNLAPRVGFVYALSRDNKTALRGGFGVFYDKIPLNVATFLQAPAEIVTRFDATGLIVLQGPLNFVHNVATPDGRLRLPYSLGWNLQLDRELAHGLLFRFGYEQRSTRRDFILDPVESLASARFDLLNSGRQSYREFQWTLRWDPAERSKLFFSYVFSRARGDLNSFDQFFGTFPNPILRANQFGPLSYDVPHRFLLWGTIGLPWKFEYSPVFELRQGFPFSAVDADLNFLGPRNAVGRLPLFYSWDFLLQRPWKVPVRHRTYTVYTGMRIYNVTAHDNPRDVQQNLTSPFFGHTFNAFGRQYRARIEFDF
jgi:hypothetical protein